MKLNPRALAYASAALWGGGVLLVGLANLAAPDYGREFLEVLSSVYPGYSAARSFDAVLIGTGYGIVYGAIGGWLFAWLYNRVRKA